MPKSTIMWICECLEGSGSINQQIDYPETQLQRFHLQPRRSLSKPIPADSGRVLVFSLDSHLQFLKRKAQLLVINSKLESNIKPWILTPARREHFGMYSFQTPQQPCLIRGITQMEQGRAAARGAKLNKRQRHPGCDGDKASGITPRLTTWQPANVRSRLSLRIVVWLSG